MIARPPGLNLRRSLLSALGGGDEPAVERAAVRQERTIDAILQRLGDDDAARRREIVLLADEVGLGKTFVALGVAWSMLHQRAAAGLVPGPVLVVTPHAHALFSKWKREAEQFLKLVAPAGTDFAVHTAERPHELVQALRHRRPTLVIARMSAFTGGLYQLDCARMAVIHALLHMDGFGLSMNQRLALLSGWETHATRETLDLRRSAGFWEEARLCETLRFDDTHVRGAWARLEGVDPKLCGRLRESWDRVRAGRERRSSFWEDIRELCRASLGQSVHHALPLVIVDEIHNWKNHPTSWERFVHVLGARVDRLLGLSATPFQLGPHELIQVLNLRRCLALPAARHRFLDGQVAALDDDLKAAESAGEQLRNAWTDISEGDVKDLAVVGRTKKGLGPQRILPSRLQGVLEAIESVRTAHGRLATTMRPFVLRHRRDTAHRAWWVGREANTDWPGPGASGSSLSWRPGLDVRGDAELVHYLMMRAVQEQKDGRGATSLGADLGGSYKFFHEGELQRLLPGRTADARRYLELVREATSENSHEHPKVAVTADRTLRAWLAGDKTLIFCFNLATVEAVRLAIANRIKARTTEVLKCAFDCQLGELDLRLKNFQKRLYNYRQSVYLIFQDHPLAGKTGRVPKTLALNNDDHVTMATRLARSGPPGPRSRFDRRSVIAVAEQVLVARWRQSQPGQKWLDVILSAWGPQQGERGGIETILASDWPIRRRFIVEGVLREAEPEELPDDEVATARALEPVAADVNAWLTVLKSRAGRATLAPYLPDRAIELPSLFSRWHSAALAQLPARLRRLAARMLRRLIRSPGFLARFILEDGRAEPTLGDSDVDDQWVPLVLRRYHATPAAGESARDRFSAYLETLQKSVGRSELIAAYEEASKNRDVVTRVTGEVDSSERDRLFMGFNTPLVPEGLIVTTVGQEGIDLHRECRHVIHHDLPWNPATLEQRTGRVDRIGSKIERMRANGSSYASLDVVVPYIAGTYDEHRFRVVHGRARLFEVTMGGEYAVDGHRASEDAMQAERIEDDVGDLGASWVPIPESIAQGLRIHLEA